MRVVAGTYKGQRLGAPGGKDTRPTADRVRVLYGFRGALGEVVEDRGNLGVGGERIYAVRMKMDGKPEKIERSECSDARRGAEIDREVACTVDGERRSANFFAPFSRSRRARHRFKLAMIASGVNA